MPSKEVVSPKVLARGRRPSEMEVSPDSLLRVSWDGFRFWFTTPCLSDYPGAAEGV